MLHDALSRKLKPLIESTRRDAIER